MRYLTAVFGIVSMVLTGCTPGASEIADRAPGASEIADGKICFIHHSTGSAWIATDKGTLGTALNANGYYVVECDYGWSDPGYDQGSSTDTGDWPDWFNDTVMPYVYANEAHFDYTNSIDDPGGEVEIVMFKSCYPNSEVGRSIVDEQAVYNSLLEYFGDHTDRMFVLVVPPPEIVINSAALTRELANWLADRDSGWLSGYAHDNVYAFDYYNVLTDPNNHHRIGASGSEEHIVSVNPVDSANPNELYYYTGTNDHPTSEGHRKATEEFLPLLNEWYDAWKGL